MVGVLDGLRLAALVEVGGEAEASLGVLDDAAELAPAPQRLLGRVLALDAPEVLLQVALHPPSPAAAAAAPADSSLARSLGSKNPCPGAHEPGLTRWLGLWGGWGVCVGVRSEERRVGKECRN